ncbi:MAG: alpha/beta fold hydrolase [Gemmobacter sp.]|nr:alpha/beta fold hydrolase [Gemmobacter sp.]
MARFLLIHGSCHGAWCWRDVIPALEAAGHQARAIDLPGRGDHSGAPGAVTLADHAQAIAAALDKPAIVVGHSMAGYPITATAELVPHKVQALVYLCAYRPVSGMSLVEMRRAGPRQPLAGVLRVSDGCFSFDPAQVPDLFYHDCPQDAVDLATARLVPEPVLPQETPLVLTAASRGVAQHYIRCANDRVIPPEYQAVMAQGLPEGHHSVLEAGHSPFFSMPETLAQRLSQIAGASVSGH